MAETFPRTFGKYRLLRKLAQGGMAEIFLAQDENKNICAIKRILPHLAHEESFIRMFIDEARIVSHLDHPNIAAVYGQDKVDAYYFIAMEFVQGHSLLALSERAKSTKMDLPRGLLAHVVAELLAGLGSAHSARDGSGHHLGIVHRDVTPQNVIISYSGDVKLIDFGVAKARARLTQTEAGFTKGKLAYMSPEQARGENLDGRSDLFSVGIILHEITTGQRLFNKEGPGGILGAIVNDPIPPPSARIRSYPKELETIVMRALAKETSQRYQTAEDMRDDLLRFARKERPVPTPKRLSSLVHDLFGDPESQRDIERAKELAAPTPAKVAVHESLVADAAALEASMPRARLDAKEDAPREPSTTRGGRSDETRMLAAGVVDLRDRSRSRVAITNPKAAAFDASVLAAAEPPVPIPKAPWRKRLGEFLRRFDAELRYSIQTSPRRWAWGAFGVVSLLMLVLAGVSGLPSSMGSWAGELVAAAKEAKSRAGLDESAPTAPRAPPKLHIETVPPGASVSVNGFGEGVTPLTLEEGLEAGQPIEIRLELEGFRVLEDRVSLRGGDREKTVSFQLEPMVGALRVTSSPPGATIRIDGKAMGARTPAVFDDLPSGEVVVAAYLSGRRSDKRTVMVQDGSERGVHFDLPVDPDKVPDGKIAVFSQPGGCPVFVDEVYAGTTPLDGFAARPGFHMVKVSCENHAAVHRDVSVRGGDVSRIDVRPTLDRFGYLKVSVRPRKGTRVQVSGRAIEADTWIQVAPGRHEVTAKNRDLSVTKRESVAVGPDERVHRVLQLTGY